MEEKTMHRREAKAPREETRRRQQPVADQRADRRHGGTDEDAERRLHAEANELVEYVPLPRAPRTTSPVPGLDQYPLAHQDAVVTGGPATAATARGCSYGTCCGSTNRSRSSTRWPAAALAKTCCAELGINCTSLDLKSGFNAVDPGAYEQLGEFEFIWLHPPYWRMIQWTDDPRCLGNAPTLGQFLEDLRQVFANCREVLVQGGRLAVLMGDWRYQGRYPSELPFRTFQAAEEEGFELDAPEIVRFSHGTTSAGRCAVQFELHPAPPRAMPCVPKNYGGTQGKVTASAEAVGWFWQ
ncbi:MAG: hypothetical protein V9H26_10815 [Verrucomicrobiota bacterium]